MGYASGLQNLIRRSSMPVVVGAAVLLASGCGGGEAGGSSDQHPGKTMSSAEMKRMTPPPSAGVVLAVTGTEYSFGPSSLKASPGKTTIRFTNKGALDHDFSIDALQVHLTAKPGKTVEATVTLKPGKYKSHCSIPGHAQSGMRGTLTVS